MLILKDIGINIFFQESLSQKQTARCPEQYIGIDENKCKYLVIHAQTQIQIFYAKRSIEMQKKIAAEIQGGMEVNFPIYYKEHEDGFYIVYKYFDRFKFVKNDFPDIWMRKNYCEKSLAYDVNDEVLSLIEDNLLSIWPTCYHNEIKKLEPFVKMHEIIRKMPKVKLSFQHGDYTFNNILSVENLVYLMDFEFSVLFQPIGFDLYDYHYSTDQIYEDIPYLEYNEVKENLINIVNAMIDADYRPVVINDGQCIDYEHSWADNMIYNRPDITNPRGYKYLTVKYNRNYYKIIYQLNLYKACLNVWLRSIPVQVLEAAVIYIFKQNINLLKIDVEYSSTNIKNELKQDNNWVIKLPSDSAEIINRLSKKSRYNFKREQRLLAETSGELSYEKYGTNIPEHILDIYFKWKKEDFGTNYNMSGTDYIKHYHVNGGMVLKAGDKIAAMLFYCINEESVYLENISYEKEFSKYSPGIILYEYFLEEMIRENCKYVFLGNGCQSYKSRFNSVEYLVFSGTIYRNNLLKLVNNLKRTFRR